MEATAREALSANIAVDVAGVGTMSVLRGTRALEVAVRHGQNEWPILGVRVNNALKDLSFELEQDCHLEFVDYRHEDGRRIYVRSLVMVLVRAAGELFPGAAVTVKHSLGNGIYGAINVGRALREQDIKLIEERMREIIAAREPIVRRRLHKDQAIKLLADSGQAEKTDLVSYRHSQEVDIYTCGGFHDYSYGPMVPDTGLLQTFRLRFYLPGYILEVPRESDPAALPEYVEHGKLANIYFEAEKWGKVLGVRNVVALNKVLQSGGGPELIRVAEAFHEKKIGQIADLIAGNIDRIRIVTIAGPTSSGKTTFAQRLATELRVNGIHPVPISLDNYFVDREKTPLDEAGRYDFESLDAIDRALFNDHLIKLIQGEEVELPYYNFKAGRREFRGEVLKLKETDLIVVEGIHGLNDRLTASIPLGRKFKIYVSALTQLNLDDHNRIPTTDLRIIRRIVRDYRCRGNSARNTIAMWPSVRRGEERNIFPFQESADVMFNSALVYELAVLKEVADPLLAEITPGFPEHSEARRLREFLSYFVSLDAGEVPANSIVREFIGNSCFLE